jgi:hypothetical protein
VNDEETPLEQFQTYYGSREQKALDGESDYVRLREAYYAGFRARPRPPLEPSRDALIEKTSTMARHYRAAYLPSPQYDDLPPREYHEGIRPYELPVTKRPWLKDAPHPDFTQYGTITGRFPTRTPQPPREDFELRAGPGQETLGRIHDKLRATGQVEYPVSDDTRDFPAVTRADTSLMPAHPGLEHTETVWKGDESPFWDADPDETMHFGAPGPVQTPLSLSGEENG